jgi:hypothetical protein
MPLTGALGRDYGGYVLDLDSLDLEEIATALADQTDYENQMNQITVRRSTISLGMPGFASAASRTVTTQLAASHDHF